MAPQLYLVCGDDEFQVTTRAKALVDELVPQAEASLGLERLDGAATTIEMALEVIASAEEAIRTPSFFGGHKLVWLQNCSFLSDAVVGKSDAVKARLERLAKTLSDGLLPGHYLLITAGKPDKRFAFYKACAGVGEVEEYSTPEKQRQAEQSARQRAIGWVREAGLEMSEPVLQHFIERVGMDSRHLNNELTKLSTYLGDRREVSLDDLDAITSASRESVAWDLSDAFGKRDLPRALELLRQLLFQQESCLRLMGMLGNRIRDLAIYREAIDRGWMQTGGGRGGALQWGEVPPDTAELYASAMARDPRKVHPYRAGLLAEQARGFSMRELRICMKLHADTQRLLVSSSRDPVVLMELLLIRMLKPRKRRPASSGCREGSRT